VNVNDTPKPAFSDTERAIVGLARAWIGQYTRWCDWCRGPLTLRDLRQYIGWCMELGKLLGKDERLPEPKVFCNNCALTAIPELLRQPVEEAPF
jgi:hypothetical protein